MGAALPRDHIKGFIMVAASSGPTLVAISGIITIDSQANSGAGYGAHQISLSARVAPDGQGGFVAGYQLYGPLLQ